MTITINTKNYTHPGLQIKQNKQNSKVQQQIKFYFIIVTRFWKIPFSSQENLESTIQLKKKT